MQSQANVTFKALNGNHHPSKREIILNDERRVVEIGRASKNSSKGLSAAVDNAWFDSPVMSRKHAEISFNTSNNTITIEDVGSMHGTWVNQQKMEVNERRALRDGDILVFGAEVTRGDETFPACLFEVLYHVIPFKANTSNTFAYPEASDIEDSQKPNTFAYPEGSDIEDEEEGYGFSEDDFGEDPFSEDDISIESQPLNKATQSNNHIDLTRDDSPAPHSPVNSSANIIEKRVIDMMAGSPTNMDQNTNVTGTSGNGPIVLDSDEEDEGFSTDSEDHSDEGLSDHVSQQYDSDESNDQDYSEDDIVSSLVNIAGSTPPPPPYVGTVPNLPSPERFSFKSSKGANTPPVGMKTLIEVPEDIMGYGVDEDDYDDDSCESDFGISKAGKEGLQKLRDDGLLGKFEESPFVKVGKSIVVVGENAPQVSPSGEQKHVTFASLCWESPNLPQPASTVAPPRQPSPSDAAMVKPAMFASQFDVKANHFPAQTLGEKSGKPAFFEARDHNKAKLHSASIDEVNFQYSSPLTPFNPGTSAESTHQELNQQRAREDALKRFRETRRMTVGEPMPMDITSSSINTGKSNASITTLPYLDDHAQIPPPPQRSLSPEPDMTSAVKYNESRASMAAVNKTAAIYSGRSKLSIHDIIDESTTNGPVSGLKRKAEDISDVVESEVRNWAASTPSDISSKSSKDLTTETQAQAVSATEDNTPSATPEQQPAKKVRRLVEHLSYAALGGAAVGAGLFSFLVASAPDFM